MTELEKMIKGAWYDTRAPELRRMSNRAKDLMRLYNSLPAENGELREEIIRLLLGKCGVNVRINQPFSWTTAAIFRWEAIAWSI